MNAQPRFSKKYCASIAIATLIGSLPVVTGLGTLYWQTDRALLGNVQRNIADSIREIDLVINLAAQSAERLIPLVGRACEEVAQQVREEVAVEPSIRSADLVRYDRAYCSSIYGAYDQEVIPADYLNGNLWLRAQDEITPHESSLVYRKQVNGISARTVIHGQTLIDIMRMSSADDTPSLQVANAFLWGSGHSDSGQHPEYASHHVISASPTHGYLVHGGYGPGYAQNVFKREAVSMLGSLMLIGFLVGGVCHWVLNRSRRQAA